MRYCNKCNNNYTNCCCRSSVVSSTTINSDQAGRDGLDAKEILIRSGVLPENATDNQFFNEIKGEKGDKGDPGNPNDITGAQAISLSSSSPATAEILTISGEKVLRVGIPQGLQGIQGPIGTPGVPGEDGSNGTDGKTPEYRYSQNGSFSTPPSIDFANRNPVGWTTSTPTEVVGSYVWQTVALINSDNTLSGNWSTPIRSTGVPGTNGSDGETGARGPSMAYRGDWDSSKEYQGNSSLVEVVKYTNGSGYLTRTDAGVIPIGTLPTNTQYFNSFTNDVDALFTDFLFAYSAYIQDLTVGNLQTDTSGERMEIIQGENKLKFFDGINTFQRLEVGIFEVDSVTGLGEPTTIQVSGIGSRNVDNTASYNFILSDQGMKIISTGSIQNRMYWGFKTISTSPLNRAYIYASFVVKGNIATDSIFSENYSVWDDDAKVVASGYTGTINGAKFINGICVGPS